MATLNPYLNFEGTTEAAFKFYQSVFGGELFIQRFKDTPEAGAVPPADAEKVMHAALKIGGNTLMATDAIESMGHKLVPGNNISLSLEAESKEEADRLFVALSEEGAITMPLADTFWGAYFGMCTDKFGMQWMVNFTYKK